MLDRFFVPPADVVRVPEAALRRTVTAIFVACGVPEAEAAEGADVLVMTDLRGVETHGVSNMMRFYVAGFKAGQINPRPRPTIVRETAGVATIDGDGGLGILQGTWAMRCAIEKARQTGVGVVVMRNSGHLGAVGHFALQAAQQDMVGLCMTATGMQVVPTFAAAPRLGTNPLAIAAPAAGAPPLLFDAATSTIAGNKVLLARRVGAMMEPAWVAGADGAPVMEAHQLDGTGAYPGGPVALLPLGGTREQGSHKGFGLGLMVEVLTTLLAGAEPNMLGPERPMARHHFAAYDVAAFGDPETFKETMGRTLRALAETPPAPGHERVVYPGLVEHETAVERRANGIPLHREVVAWFNECTDDFGLPRLETR